MNLVGKTLFSCLAVFLNGCGSRQSHYFDECCFSAIVAKKKIISLLINQLIQLKNMVAFTELARHGDNAVFGEFAEFALIEV